MGSVVQIGYAPTNGLSPRSGQVVTPTTPLPVVAYDAAGVAVMGTPAAGADNVSNPTLGALISYLMGFDGTNWDRIRLASSAGGLSVAENVDRGGNIVDKFVTPADALTNAARYPITLLSGFNGTSWDRLRTKGTGILQVEESYTPGRVTADGQIKGSAGFIHTVTLAPLTATPTAGLITIYDSLTETGTVLYAEWFFATDQGHTITLDIAAGTGIYVGYDATAANIQVTVSYR